MSASLNLRCSALPLAFRCAAAIRPSAIPMNASNDAANDGTAVHEVLRSLPTTDRLDWDAIPEIAKRFNATPGDVRMLAAQGVKLWNQVKESFRGAMTEVDLRYEIVPGVFLTGHADMLAIAQRAMRVADWKSGRKDRDHSQQFKGYAVLSLLASEDIDEVTSTGLWIRDQEIENYTLDRAAAIRWKNDLIERVIEWDGVYRPGSHCAYCPRNHECDAANALVRRDVAAIADKSLVARVESELALMSDSEKVAIFQKADLVVKFAERVRAAVKAYVETNGDIVADGVRLTIATENRRDIDPQKAWPILAAAGFDDTDFAEVMTFGASKIDAVIRHKADKGKGASAVRELDAKLRAAGAIDTRTINKLTEKRSA